MTLPDEHTRPTIGKVYDAIAEVKTDVAVIRHQLVDIADHEKRLRNLEQRFWLAIGGFGLLAAIAPYIVRFIE